MGKISNLSRIEFRIVDVLCAAEKDGRRIFLSKSKNEQLLSIGDRSYYQIRERKPATIYECKVVELPINANVIEIRRSEEDLALARFPKKAFEAVRRLGKPIHTTRYVGWLVEKGNTDAALVALANVGIFTENTTKGRTIITIAHDDYNRDKSEKLSGINLFKAKMAARMDANNSIQYEIKYEFINSHIGNPREILTKLFFHLGIENSFHFRRAHIDILGYNKYEPIEDNYRFIEMQFPSKSHRPSKTIITCAKPSFMMSEYEKVLKICNEKIAENPQDLFSWIKMADILSANKNYINAINTYDEAIEIYPESIEAQLKKGIALEAQQKYGDAIRAYDRILKIDPQNLRAWKRKEDNFHKQGKHEDAESARKIILKINPSEYMDIDTFDYANESEKVSSLRRQLLSTD